MDVIEIFRSGNLVEAIKPNDDSTQLKKIMGENELQVSFELNHVVSFNIGDYCMAYGERYSINQLPVITKVSTYRYEYSMVLQAQGFDLGKVQYLFFGDNNAMKESDFSLMGNADTFLDLIMKNLERVQPGVWQRGQTLPTSYKNLSFSKDNCYNALGKIAEAFDTEFWIEGNVIHITKRSFNTGWAFRHGKNKGLYEITRQLVSDTDIITRLYVFGADKNLPPDYNNYAKRLQMRDGDNTVELIPYNPKLVSNVSWNAALTSGATERVKFVWTPPEDTSITEVILEVRFKDSFEPYFQITLDVASPAPQDFLWGLLECRIRSTPTDVTPSFIVGITGDLVYTDPIFPPDPTEKIVYAPALPYIEKNVAKYGVIEQTEIFDDIFPSRTGKVTAVDAASPYRFKDATIDFDLNNQLLPGTAAKITFNTGQLAGYTFDVAAFNNTTKEVRFNKNQNETALEIPNDNLRPAIGDTYVFTDILMPQSYIDDAEKRLKTKAQATLDTYADPQYSYVIKFDPKYLREKVIMPKIGDVVWLIDLELEVNKAIRVSSVTRNIVNEYDVQVELTDILSKGTIAQINSAINAANNNIANSDYNVAGLLNNKVVGDFTIQQGTVVIPNIQEAPASANLRGLAIDTNTGKVYRE